MDKLTLAKIFQRTGAFKTGHFILASGKESDVYVDCRLVTMDPDGLDEITQQFLKLAIEKKLLCDLVGGVTSGADPIVTAYMLYSKATGFFPARAFYVRKEAKTHGTKKNVEGHLNGGKQVIIFDDVATTGGSSQIAIDAVHAAGSKVVAVCVVVDREEGAKEKFASQGIPLYSLLTLNDLRSLLLQTSA